MVTLQDIPTPFFVVNQNVFVKNCQRALEYCECNSMRMRPHIKTHKTLQGAWIQAYGQPRNQRNEVDGGVVSPTENNDLGGPDDKRLKSPLVTGFVASTIAEVRLLAESGLGGPFDDILYGVPIASTSKIAILDQIQQRHANVTIHLFVDHPRQVQMLDDYCISTSRKHPFSIFLKLDTGYHRAGVSCDDRGVDLASQIVLSDQLVLKGVYSHCGHAYDSNDSQAHTEIAQTDMTCIQSFLQSLQLKLKETSFSLSDLVVSVGSTPSLFHHHNDFALPNLEIHPGNYTFYDRQQLWTGACPSELDVCGRVMATVIGHYPDRNTILLDAGATALTKDTTPQGGVCSIGIGGKSPSAVECYKMSQEVTLVRPKEEGTPFPFEQYPIGSMVDLLPNHSCLAAACFETYKIIDDETGSYKPDTPIVDEWVPAKFFN